MHTPQKILQNTGNTWSVCPCLCLSLSCCLCLIVTGITERQLPGPLEVSDFGELLALMESVGATARITTDPLPFLNTTKPALDRWVEQAHMFCPVDAFADSRR
jgi:hypothetical protein